MIYLAAMDPNLPSFVILGLIIVGLVLILRYFKQPYVIAYILAGVLLGEHGFQIVTDEEVIASFGEFGLIILLFFIGMEVSLMDLLRQWRLASLGTLVQIMASILLVGIIGYFMGWSMNQIIVFGFVMSLSSSAVVVKLLQDNGETQSPVGRSAISVLLMQDILIVPMLIITGYLGGMKPSTAEITSQLVGGVLIILGIVWVVRKQVINLPYSKEIKEDGELQVFVSFIFCFGFAWVTAMLGLSAALGAFVGGIFVRAACSTEMFHESLQSFRVIFVALFFVSIGMLIDVEFLLEHWVTVLLLIAVVYVSNHFINAFILQYFCQNWGNSLYGGALLAQIGELSFIIAATASQSHIISDYGYQLTIITISMTLLLSPFWIGLSKFAFR